MVVKKKKKRKREGGKKRRQPLFHAITPSKIARVGRIRVRLNRSKAAGSPRDPVRRLEISTIWRGLFDFLPRVEDPCARNERTETSSAIKSHKRTADCSILVNTRMFQMFGGCVWKPIVRGCGIFSKPIAVSMVLDICDLKILIVGGRVLLKKETWMEFLFIRSFSSSFFSFFYFIYETFRINSRFFSFFSSSPDFLAGFTGFSGI